MQGYCILKTGQVCVEDHILFFTPRIQHVGAGVSPPRPADAQGVQPEEGLFETATLDLAFTRYCHYQYCMVYGIQTGGRGRESYIAQ